MLSFKDWKSLNESYDFSLGLATPNTVGIQSQAGGVSFAELLEAKKKMKKKMFGDNEIPDDEEEDEEEEEVQVPDEDHDDEEDHDEEEGEVEDAETGDGEVVEPASLKDKKMLPNDKANFLSNMKKKMKNKMKKKMAAEGTSVLDNNVEDVWLQSIKSMITFKDPRNDGLTDYTNEDALMPFIDPNTGFTRKPEPGEVGFAPQGKIGEE